MNHIIIEDVKNIVNDNPSLKNTKNSSFAITGASGMIGSYIVSTLIFLNKEYKANNKIIAFVRDKNKLDKHFFDDENFEAIIYDVTEPLNYDIEVDYFIHAASPASPIIMKNKPFETNLANTVGCANTLKFSIQNKVKKYLFISSREIYGQPNKNQEYFYEDGELGYIDNLIPRNGYAEGKRAAENMCISCKEEYGLDTKIVRLAHTYGPYMSINDGRVQADFLKNIVNHEDIVMKSTGESVRTYTYVGDAVNAIFKVLLDSKDVVYNISSPDSKVTIRELAERLVKLYEDRKIKLVTNIDNSNVKGNASFTLGILSSDKIEKELNWKPLYSIEEGFKRTVNYIENN